VKLLTDQVIVVRGDRIERIAGSRELQIPAGATAVDLTRAAVLLGLIDCHTHIMLTDTDDSHSAFCIVGITISHLKPAGVDGLHEIY
jgi:imidazolonepropionase-like amidohydrolase